MNGLYALFFRCVIEMNIVSRISKLWHRSGWLCLLAMLVAPGEAGEPIDYARGCPPHPLASLLCVPWTG